MPTGTPVGNDYLCNTVNRLVERHSLIGVTRVYIGGQANYRCPSICLHGDLDRILFETAIHGCEQVSVAAVSIVRQYRHIKRR
jgi:hypothetical protein